VIQPTVQAFDELVLFKSNRTAWMDLSAPRIAARIAAMDDKQIDHCWQTMMKDLRKQVWLLLDEPQKARVRTIRPGDAQPTIKAE